MQTEAISPRVPEATQDKGKRATRSTSHLPVAKEKRAPKLRQQTKVPQGNVGSTKKTQAQSATAQLQAQNAKPTAETRLKSMGIAKAANRRFARMENEVQQALAVMDKQTGQILNYCHLLRDPKYKKEWNISAAN